MSPICWPWPCPGQPSLGLIAGAYLALNLLFAGFYLLEPNGLGGIAGSRTSFAEAFFFSVQTLGSIGCGSLAPLGLRAYLAVDEVSREGHRLMPLPAAHAGPVRHGDETFFAARGPTARAARWRR